MSKLVHAITAGAIIKAIPKLVEVSGLAECVAELKALAADQQTAYVRQNEILIGAINRLVDAIKEKEMTNEGTDLSELIAAVTAMKQEVIVQPTPSDWQVDFERDQRGLMKSGITLKVLPRVIN
jgi:hypothetical protein